MPDIREITDLSAPELDIYARASPRASCFTITNRIRAFLLLKAPRSLAGPWMPDMSRCPF